MKKIIALIITISAIILISSNPAMADASDKGHGKMKMPAADTSDEGHGKMKMPAAGAFKHQMIDKHIRAEFQIMSLASMNMKDPDGATHHVMVKLYDNIGNKPVKEAVGKVKVIGPDKSEQTNGLKNYNGIFAANFTFSSKGKYGVICLVKIDGKKYLFKFWYPHE